MQDGGLGLLYMPHFSTANLVIPAKAGIHHLGYPQTRSFRYEERAGDGFLPSRE
jgi:hypothetical protein